MALIHIDMVIRSARRSIALIIQPDGSLLVRAPHQATDAQVREFIDQKSAWIQKHQDNAVRRKAEQKPRQFIAGEAFLFLGSSYPLRIRDKTKPQIALEDGALWLSRSVHSRAGDQLTTWYKRQARRLLAERLRLAARQHGLEYKRFRLSSARTRWGSCSSNGTISLTWRLVMAPLAVIDYVIIHELAHIQVKNHSRAFWDKVAEMMPDFQDRRQWLKENGRLLTIN